MCRARKFQRPSRAEMGGLRKLGMDSAHRWAMLRNMVTSLIYHERIMTTTPRAKELRRVAEKMITHAKVSELHHRRFLSNISPTTCVDPGSGPPVPALPLLGSRE